MYTINNNCKVTVTKNSRDQQKIQKFSIFTVFQQILVNDAATKMQAQDNYINMRNMTYLRE